MESASLSVTLGGKKQLAANRKIHPDIRGFGICAYSLSCQRLKEKINPTLMSINYSQPLVSLIYLKHW